MGVLKTNKHIFFFSLRLQNKYPQLTTTTSSSRATLYATLEESILQQQQQQRTTTTTMTTMKAAILHKNGDPSTTEVLSVEENVEIPKPKTGEILIKVKAAAMNPVDWKFWNGSFAGKTSGFVGIDVCGIVHEIGVDTNTTLKVGDAIYADSIATQGAFAEYCIVEEIAASLKPTNISFAQAASIPLAGLTALQGLVTHGNFQSGQSVCILGGSGGVGSLAVSMAKKALGASHVYATGSSVDMIKKLGADTVINYKEESILDQLKGKDIDLIFDCVGGYEGWEVAQHALKKDTGLFVSIVGDNTGSLVKTMGQMFYRKFCYMLGMNPSYHIFLTNTKAPAIITDMKQLTSMIESEQIKPIVEESQYYKLTTDSLQDMIKVSMSHRAKGKLVMIIEE